LLDHVAEVARLRWWFASPFACLKAWPVVGLADLEPGRSTSLLMAVASPEVVTCMSAVSSDAGTGQQTLDTARIEPGFRLDV